MAELRRLLETVDFTEPVLCARLDLPDLYAFEPAGPRPDRPADLLDVLIVLFLDGTVVEGDAYEHLVPAAARAALDELGLVIRLEDGRRHATVNLYPTRSLHLISDSPVDPLTGRTRQRERERAPDAVYPAITAAARDFVAVLPSRPGTRVLELCSGTGVGALLAALHAEQAWAVDITERSTRFAAFNADLNGLDNVTALQGDLYEPVEGHRFDTILAHPPYMQSEEVREIYRDGGIDGEAVTRRILGGLARHLAPGGRFHCTCLLTDRKGIDLEDRIREMIGPDAGDFDLLLMPMKSMEPRKALFDEAVEGRVTLEQTRRREAAYGELGVHDLVYCSMVLERRMDGRATRTFRRPRRRATTGEAVEWLMDWEVGPPGRLSATELRAARPSVPVQVEAVTDLTLEEGRWRPTEITVRTPWPFPASVRCASWVLDLLARCDGTRTVAEVLDSLRQDGLLSADAPADGLLNMVRSFVSAGLLELPTHPLPPRPAEPEASRA